MSEAIGMMEGAFFVPRTQLLQWINTTFDMNVQKVEQCASAAVYCQIMDALYPGKVAMSKVNWSAKHEYEFVKNFKVLQDAFDKAGIQKHIEVEKLVKAKYQDNLEMLQWMKRYFDMHTGDRVLNYDALERRKGATALPDWAKGGFHKRAAVVGGGVAGEKENKSAANSKMPMAKKAAAPKEATAAKGTVVKTSAPTAAAAGSKTDAKPAAASGKCGECERVKKEMQETVEGAERERDFYFGKLRDIEIMCQTATGEQINVKDILKILYKNDDETATPQQETQTHTETVAVQPAAVEAESY